MLSMNAYPQATLDACRARLDAQVAAYRDVVADADRGAVATFEPAFFNGLVVQLEHTFVHRMRGMEKKDGNPLNEVRLLAQGLVDGDGTLPEEKGIRLKPETSVLGLGAGDPILLSEDDFARLLDAFLADLEAKYVTG